MSDAVLWVLLGIGLGVGIFYVGIKIAIALLINRIKNEIDSIADELDEAEKDVKISCRVEQHNQEFYVYNDDTNEFMAQGKTVLELREKIKARWANKRVSVVAGEDHVLEQLRAQLNESSSSK